VITSALVDQATARFCPSHGKTNGSDHLSWTNEAKALVESRGDSSTVADIRLRAEKCARRDAAAEVTIDHVRPFLGTQADARPTWCAAALARLVRLPEMAREAVRGRAETRARDAGEAEVTLEIVEAALVDSRRAMEQVMHAGGHKLRPQKNE
jgi:hypothetical protein